MTTACIVQARMTSRRLPGKTMYPLAGKPVIWHVLTRCQRIPGVDMVVLAVPRDPVSAPLEREAEALGVTVVWGSEADVLSRYHAAAVTVGARMIMRVTGDCPLIDPSVCGRVLALLGDGIEYASNVQPRGFPQGLDCEVFTFRALDEAHRKAVRSADREHVTPYIIRKNVRRANLPGDGNTGLRLTLDTPDDYEFLKARFAA